MDLGVLQASVNLNTSNFSKGVADVQRGFSELGKAAIVLNQSMQAIHEIADKTIDRVVELGRSFLETGEKMAMMRLTLDTITKGHGTEKFNEINEWAIKMPIYTEQAIEAFVKLNAMGFHPTIQQMTIMTDTMAALGNKPEVFDALAGAIGRMTAFGTVHLRQLYMLINAGIPVFEILRKYSTLSEDEIRKLGNQGAVSADVIKVLLYGLDQMYGGMSEKMKTMLGGLEKGFAGYWTYFKDEVMKSGVMEYIEKELGKVMAYLDQLKASGQMNEIAKELAEYAERGLAVFVDLVTYIWNSRDAIKETMNAIVGFGKEAWDGLKVVKDTASDIFSTATSILGGMSDDVLKVGVIGLLLIGKGGAIGVITAILALINDFEQRRQALLSQAADQGLTNVPGNASPGTNNALNSTWEGIKNLFSSSGSMDGVDDFGRIVSEIGDSTEKTADQTNRLKESYDSLNMAIIDLQVDKIMQGFDDTNKKNLEAKPEVDNLAGAFQEFKNKGEEIPKMLAEVNAAITASIAGFMALNGAVSSFALPQLNLNASITSGVNLPIPPSTAPTQKFPIELTKDSGGKGGQKAENAMATVRGQVKLLQAELDGISMAKLSYEILKVGGEYDKMVEKYKKYFESHPEMKEQIDLWGALKEKITIAKEAKESWNKLSDTLDEEKFKAANALLDTQHQALGQIEFDTQKLRIEFGRIWDDLAKSWEKMSPEMKALFGGVMPTKPKFIEDMTEQIRQAKILGDINKTIGDLNQQTATQWYANAGAGLSDYNQVLWQTAQLLDQNKDKTEAVRQAILKWNQVKLDGLMNETMAAIQKLSSIKDTLKEAFDKMGDTLGNAIAEGLKTGKMSFKAIVQALIQDLEITAAHHLAKLTMTAIFEGVMALADPANAAKHAETAMMALKGIPVMLGFVTGAALGNLKGMGHEGMDNIPERGTWLLDKGERVVGASLNKDLTDFLKNKGKESPTPIMNVTINGGDEKGVMAALPVLQKHVLDWISDDISSGGKTRKTIIAYTR